MNLLVDTVSKLILKFIWHDYILSDNFGNHTIEESQPSDIQTLVKLN